jgi:ATP-dependent exoDNAse (exonuclease V) beta subunit
MNLRDPRDGNARQVRVRIEPVVAAGDEDVVHVEEDVAVRPVRDLGEEVQADLFGAPESTRNRQLAVRLLDWTPEREIAIRRLTNAVRGFDEAAIFTIHGFCKRVLGDNAFESGLSFETELLADTGDLLQEIIDDFWRRELYPAEPIVAQYFLDAGYSPEVLRRQIERHLNKPYLRVVAPAGVSDGAALTETFAAAFHQARIRAKALRYALEFHAELYGRSLRRLLQPLMRLQDLLGQHQDEVGARERLGSCLPTGREATR